MKIELTELSPIKKSLSIEAEPDEVKKETEAVVLRFAQRVRVPGFRPGKAPLSVVRTRFADEIREDVRDRLVVRLYREAAIDQGLHPIGEPRIEEVSDAVGQPFRFRTTFEVIPEFTPRGLHGVEVREPTARVHEPEIDEALEQLRQAQVRLVAEEGRSAATGDIIIADVEGRSGGGEPFRRERVMLEVGATDNLTEFNDGILGATAGSVRRFRVSYPKEFETASIAGKVVDYALVIHEVKRRDIPELDDEFAKDLGDFETLEALRERVRTDLLERKRAEARLAVRQAVLDKVLLENPVPLPESLVAEEIQRRLEDVIRMMMQQGLEPQKMELDWRQLHERQEAGARRAVHARLVLDGVAAAEAIEVGPEEFEERINAEAQRMGEPAHKLRSRLERAGGLEALRNQVVREKSLDFLTSVANIQREE